MAEVKDHILFFIKVDLFIIASMQTVAQSSDEIKYYAERTTRMSLVYSRMINNELLNNYTDVVLEQAPLIILDIKSNICTA